MGSITDFLENAWLNHICNAAFVPSTPIYLALCTADPTDAAIGASMSEQPVVNAYARQPITFNAAASRAIVQAGAVTFPQASGPWSTITHWAVVSSAAGAGNVYAHGSFTASFTPVSGNTPTVPAGSIQVQVAASSGAGFTDYAVHALLNLTFRNTAFAKPPTYIGLCTATLTDTSVTAPASEVATGSYARKLVNTNVSGIVPKWDLAAGGTLDNAEDITFVTPTAAWGTITSCFIIDSASGAGNVLGYDNANIVDQNPQANDIVLFPAGQFDLTLT
jgi:hypothetical protein